MRIGDLPQILAVQAVAYGDVMLESEAALGSRLALSPGTCWVAEDTPRARGEASIAGYLFSHPWHLAAPPPLDTILDALPEAPDCWYVHDMALAPRTRGAGVAGQLYAAALTAVTAVPARGLRSSALVAVQQSQGFWARFGYAAVTDVSPLIAAKLAGYGDGAVFMTRTL
ncbi:hypothetical protein AB870_09540 [Pandoraea faecigallinarum]|uniref:N-acetyltransferase domain-containing protein n=1 Tax=Pandoraea faecigallinarum TaxID=656179 RepID=A0A0H3WQ52_9BURK|nr:GNAT family N-acetyltransferase [Pandoraea faecigallinarum]AKM30294.1 hypothetical protein AB870_09540 [Pandoraea faecigallinarum]